MRINQIWGESNSGVEAGTSMFDALLIYLDECYKQSEAKEKPCKHEQEKIAAADAVKETLKRFQV